MLEVIKTNIVRLALVSLVLLSSALLNPQLAGASAFGNGDTAYGECAYGFGCSKPTQVVTPAGLKVSINLEDGQTIPRSGYTVIVTPLNGEGRTFDYVEFWLGGVLVHTAEPGSNGTATWFWDPEEFPGTQLKVVVVDTDGSQITEEFTLVIAKPGSQPIQAPTGHTDAPSETDNQNVFSRLASQVGATYQSLFEGAKDLIRAVPAPVVFAFPYFLLLLLMLNMILLVSQARKELEEYKVLQALVARASAVVESKKNLAQLTSHYLRTPLTLLMGGVDMLKLDPSVQAAAKEFDEITNRIHLKVESLIRETVDAAEVGQLEGFADNRSTVWRQRGLFLPVILLPLVLVPFNYVAASAGMFTNVQVNAAAQVILFAIFMTVIYIVLRHRQLRERDAKRLREVMDAEAAVNNSRDALIKKTADLLDEDLKEIDTLLANVGTTEAAEFIGAGQARYQELVSKLRVANRLQGLHSEAPVSEVVFNELFTKAMAAEKSKAEAKHVAVNAGGESVVVRTQSPDLAAFALQSLIDNAVAYSKDNSAVEVIAGAQGTQTVVTVTDHGVGIPPEKLSMLFQPFTKVEGSEVFTHEGMGFSLYLVKLITEYIGADIDATSRPGAGTTLNLRFSNQTAR